MLKARVLRQLGITFMILGAILLVYGLFFFTLVYNCPANGCPAVAPFRTSDYPFFLGLSLMIIGIILFLASKLVKEPLA